MLSKTRLPEAAARVSLLRQAVTKTPTPALMRALSEALLETDAGTEAAAWFRSAFLRDPNDAVLRQAATDPDSTIARARAFIANGAAFSPVIAALALALAGLGRREEVAELMDYERFLVVRQLPEAGGLSLDELRAGLIAEILASLTPYATPTDRAIRHAMRGDGLLSSTTPVAAAFRAALEACVRDYIEAVPQDRHPFALSTPAQWALEGWAVVSDERSFHTSHIHPRAWLSGVCYLARPNASYDRDRRIGWLRIAAPDHASLPVAADWPERWIEPVVGSVVLMPAYFFHETRPIQVPEQRICVAFDVVPLEIATGSHPR